jgi:DNA-binding HxlR family transcriptional regulator
MDSEQPVYCPAKAVLALLEQKWVLRIIEGLLSGPKRFNELAAAIGNVNSRTLSERLKELEDEEIVRRTVKESIPPWVEYELTEKGLSLRELLDFISNWSQKWMSRENLATNLLADNKSG